MTTTTIKDLTSILTRIDNHEDMKNNAFVFPSTNSKEFIHFTEIHPTLNHFKGFVFSEIRLIEYLSNVYSNVRRYLIHDIDFSYALFHGPIMYLSKKYVNGEYEYLRILYHYSRFMPIAEPTKQTSGSFIPVIATHIFSYLLANYEEFGVYCNSGTEKETVNDSSVADNTIPDYFDCTLFKDTCAMRKALISNKFKNRDKDGNTPKSIGTDFDGDVAARCDVYDKDLVNAFFESIGLKLFQPINANVSNVTLDDRSSHIDPWKIFPNIHEKDLPNVYLMDVVFFTKFLYIERVRILNYLITVKNVCNSRIDLSDNDNDLLFNTPIKCIWSIEDLTTRGEYGRILLYYYYMHEKDGVCMDNQVSRAIAFLIYQNFYEYLPNYVCKKEFLTSCVYTEGLEYIHQRLCHEKIPTKF